MVAGEGGGGGLFNAGGICASRAGRGGGLHAFGNHQGLCGSPAELLRLLLIEIDVACDGFTDWLAVRC